jgi:hypothetical protein
VARCCDLLLLTVPDDALAPLVDDLVAAGSIRAGQVIVHTSGRYGIAVLAPAAAVGASVLAIHPALTFTGTDVDLDRLPSGRRRGRRPPGLRRPPRSSTATCPAAYFPEIAGGPGRARGLGHE